MGSTKTTPYHGECKHVRKQQGCMLRLYSVKDNHLDGRSTFCKRLDDQAHALQHRHAVPRVVSSANGPFRSIQGLHKPRENGARRRKH
jgi:hypothetical protein